MTARWDGKGVPGGVVGEAISRPLRIVRVAHDFVAVADGRDVEGALEALSRRRGRGCDPQVVDAALAEPGALLRAADVPDAFGRVIDAEPLPVTTISSAAVEVVAGLRWGSCAVRRRVVGCTSMGFRPALRLVTGSRLASDDGFIPGPSQR